MRRRGLDVLVARERAPSGTSPRLATSASPVERAPEPRACRARRASCCHAARRWRNWRYGSSWRSPSPTRGRRSASTSAAASGRSCERVGRRGDARRRSSPVDARSRSPPRELVGRADVAGRSVPPQRDVLDAGFRRARPRTCASSTRPRRPAARAGNDEQVAVVVARVVGRLDDEVVAAIGDPCRASRASASSVGSARLRTFT